MLQRLHIQGYRSVRDLSLVLQPISVLTGPNGCGKSNLYNSLVLVARAAEGRLARAIAAEGGTPSVLWAGGERIRLQRKQPPRRVNISFELEDFGYELQIGLPSLNDQAIATKFKLDPVVSEESIWPTGAGRRLLMLKRERPTAWLRNADGQMVTYPYAITKSESVLSQILEPELYPEISRVRSRMLGWRFYHHFRTDSESPLRQPQTGMYTPVLSSDGSDLAAALQTILEIGDEAALREAIRSALGGAALEISAESTRFSIGLRIPGLLRPLDCREFSDGQLRFLCLCAALLSPRPPTLLALNEPETSLHPDLIDSLARLLVHAAKHSQLWITTHSAELAARVEEYSGQPRVRLELANGETRLADSDTARPVPVIGRR